MPVEYTGAGGARQWYGPRTSPVTAPDPAVAKESMYGNIQELELNFAFDNVPNPSALSANDAAEFVIPANSFIISARLFTPVAWVGGTSVALDTRVPATGAVQTANALVTATQGATANLTANSWIVGTGGVVGLTVGTLPVKIGATVVGTFTAGRSRLLISYIPPVG